MTIDEAARERWSVIVAGAGPAGAVTARQLAREGASVLLVDRASFPRRKVCGCCLNGAALRALDAIGLGDLVSRSGALRLSRMRLAVGPSRATLRLPGGVALSREQFDSTLVDEAVAAGVAFLPGTEAVLLSDADARCEVRLRSGDAEVSARACLAVAADGLGGTFLRSCDRLAPRVATDSPIGAGAVFDEAPAFFEPGTIFMACGRGAYVGAVRLEDGRLDVAAAIDGKHLRQSAGLASLLGDTMERAGFPLPHGFEDAPWRGTPPLTRSRRRVAAHRVFVVGDSAGYVEPFTGEGMAWAIQGAMLLAPLVLDGLERWDARLGRAWERRYRRFFRNRRRICTLVRTVLRHRRIARMTVSVLGLAPWLAAPGLRAIAALSPQVRALAKGKSA